MGTIRYYLVRAWIWLVFAWHKVRTFVPWKAIILSWLIAMAISFVLNMVCTMMFGHPIPGLLDFVLYAVMFIFIYPAMFKRCYPNGWQG